MPFPTGVGMNRNANARGMKRRSVPHRRGDEPLSGRDKEVMCRPFPTGVGMNRKEQAQSLFEEGVGKP